jgi:hypothetical protein
MGRDKWAAIADEAVPGEMTDTTGGVHYEDNEMYSDQPYEGARTMADFLRTTAKVVEGMAKGFAVFFLVCGCIAFFGQGSFWIPGGKVLGIAMVIPAALIWLLAKPIATIYRGLGDLTDAHLDLVVKSLEKP